MYTKVTSERKGMFLMFCMGDETPLRNIHAQVTALKFHYKCIDLALWLCLSSSCNLLMVSLSH